MLKKFIMALAMIMLLSVSVAAAQDNRTLTWQRWDVLIDNVDTTANQFHVTESYDMQFNGTFHYGSRVIPTDRVESIGDVQVMEGGQALRQNCSNQPGTYCVSNDQNNLSVTYYFVRTITNSTDHIEISYTVKGALRVYTGGDQLWWGAIPSNHFGFPIESSTITVKMPPGYGPREGVDPVVTYGASATVDVTGTTIVAKAKGALTGNDSLDLRIQYPHDPNAQSPVWQAGFDQTRAFQESVMPWINLGVIALSLVIAIGGVLFIYVLYQRKGRDPKIGPVPTYLADPPSELPPAVVGTLVDERADPRDVISTVIDLAHKGYLAIEEEQKEGVFGIGRSSSFTFKRTDKSLDSLRPFELRLMNRLFTQNRLERTMDSLRNTFYTVITQVQSDLYKELVTDQFFSVSPSTTRAIWSGIGVVIFGLAMVLGFFLMPLVDNYGIVPLLVPGALIVVAIAAFIVGPNMPAKTPKGAEEAAKWKAFYEYLRNLEKYVKVEEASAQFERYLPYAVAFGLDKSWIHKFSQLQDVPIPIWYYPTYIGPYHRGYIAGTPLSAGNFNMGNAGGMPGGLAHAGGGVSLDKMSGNLAGGLDSISTGLSSMLDSASRTMTSRPQASSGSSGSWRSGGGGWSGGGFSGGGFSGGGSSGFG